MNKKYTTLFFLWSFLMAGEGCKTNPPTDSHQQWDALPLPKESLSPVATRQLVVFVADAGKPNLNLSDDSSDRLQSQILPAALTGIVGALLSGGSVGAFMKLYKKSEAKPKTASIEIRNSAGPKMDLEIKQASIERLEAQITEANKQLEEAQVNLEALQASKKQLKTIFAETVDARVSNYKAQINELKAKLEAGQGDAEPIIMPLAQPSETAGEKIVLGVFHLDSAKAHTKAKELSTATVDTTYVVLEIDPVTLKTKLTTYFKAKPSSQFVQLELPKPRPMPLVDDIHNQRIFSAKEIVEYATPIQSYFPKSSEVSVKISGHSSSLDTIRKEISELSGIPNYVDRVEITTKDGTFEVTELRSPEAILIRKKP